MNEPPILRAIRHAVVVGRCEERARRDKSSAPGLLKVARFHRALAAAFLVDALEQAGL